jgi:hypothetical protein
MSGTSPTSGTSLTSAPSLPSGTSLASIEAFTLWVLIFGWLLFLLIRWLARSRREFNVAGPLAIGFAIRIVALLGVSASGQLSATLRGGDETTFLDYAKDLAAQPLGTGDIPHGRYQLHTVLFGLQIKLGFLPVNALRVTQVAIATAGVILLVAAVYDLAGRRAARLAAWIIALEPASIFFNSALHKEPNMELASGLVVFGGTMLWRRLDVRGILLFGLGGAIAVGTRSYAGWFLVSAAVFVLLHAALRNMSRPLRALPAVYAVGIVAFLATPAILAASSSKNLQQLQQSQNANANAIGTGSSGPNTDNLKLENVDFSTRGKLITNLPKRLRDLIVKPYPWQLANTNQKFGAIGTLVAYAIFLMLVVYGWQSRGKIFPRAGPVLYPMLFLLVAYALAAGNAGTGFRYRTHLVTLAIAAMAILREQAALSREARSVAVGLPTGPHAESAHDALPTPA